MQKSATHISASAAQAAAAPISSSGFSLRRFRQFKLGPSMALMSLVAASALLLAGSVKAHQDTSGQDGADGQNTYSQNTYDQNAGNQNTYDQNTTDQNATDQNTTDQNAYSQNTYSGGQGEQVNLHIEKVANPQYCSKVPTGWSCYFNITVTNASMGTYTDQIEINDVIPPGTTAIFSDPQWTCAANQPSTYTCTYPAGSFGPGQRVSLPVQVDVPSSVARTLNCQVPNQAQITQPQGGAEQNSKAEDDSASATALIPGCGAGYTPPSAPPAPAAPMQYSGPQAAPAGGPEPGHDPRFSGSHWRSFSPGHSRRFSPGHWRSFSPGHWRSFSPGHRRGFSPGHWRGFSPIHRRPFSPHSRGFSPIHRRPFSPHFRPFSPSCPPGAHCRVFSPRPHIRGLSPRPHIRGLSPRPHIRGLSPRPHARPFSPRPHARPFSPVRPHVRPFSRPHHIAISRVRVPRHHVGLSRVRINRHHVGLSRVRINRHHVGLSRVRVHRPKHFRPAFVRPRPQMRRFNQGPRVRHFHRGVPRFSSHRGGGRRR